MILVSQKKDELKEKTIFKLPYTTKQTNWSELEKEMNIRKEERQKRIND